MRGRVTEARNIAYLIYLLAFRAGPTQQMALAGGGCGGPRVCSPSECPPGTPQGPPGI